MSNSSNFQNRLKAIKLLQENSKDIKQSHEEISKDLVNIKSRLKRLSKEALGYDVSETKEFNEKKDNFLNTNNNTTAVKKSSIEYIYSEARNRFDKNLTIDDILSLDDKEEINLIIQNKIGDFDKRYSLDKWDYAIAGSCGLFASILDILCVSTPLKPTTPFEQEPSGIFNKITQDLFNFLLPPEKSTKLSKNFPIGSADVSTLDNIIDAPAKTLNPINHRLKELSHDPVLGLFFGILDMVSGKVTIADGGRITSYKTTREPIDDNILNLVKRIIGHLLSDVNAPSANGNRGMGIPAPFMGLLAMFNNVNIGNVNIGDTAEYAYVRGYDFRHFLATSIPVAIMEILIRTFYIIKQIKLYNKSFKEAFLDTVPTKPNPRVRMMLTLGYGTFCAVNAGKVYVTKNILNANYSAWLGLTWNTFFSLKWALYDKHMKLWNEIEKEQLVELIETNKKLDDLIKRAELLEIKKSQ